MKKVLALALAISFVLTMTACSSNNSKQTANSAETAKTETKTEDTTPSAKILNDKGTIGDYSVEIESARLDKNYKKKPAIVIKYKYTNKSGKAASLGEAFDLKAFQDGVELESTNVDDTDESSLLRNYYKAIKKEASLEVEYAYLISNQKSPAEIEITSPDDEDVKIVKTFDVTKLK